MCGKLKPGKEIYNRYGIKEEPGVIEPGENLRALFLDSTREMVFGFNSGNIYNVRFETLHETLPDIQGQVCGVITDKFEERGLTVRIPKEHLLLGVWKGNEVAILTQSSKRIGRAPIIHHESEIIRRIAS